MNQYSILVFLGTAVAGTAVAQSTTTTYQRDQNGREVAVSSSSVAADGEQTREIVQSINGRPTPRERVSERIIRSDANSKVTERTIRRFDGTGAVAGTERVVIEETAGPGGSKTVKESIFRNRTVNGPLQEEQRSTSETRVDGDVTTTQVTVDRASLSRSFATTERREIVTKGASQNQQTTETIFAPSESGRFAVFQRKETTTTTKGGETKSTLAVYDSHNGSEPALSSQTVATTTRRPDGSETTETNVYAPGLATWSKSGAPTEIQLQQIVEKRVAADGSVTETVSERYPMGTDGGRLSAPKVVSETVCHGKCIVAKPDAPKQ